MLEVHPILMDYKLLLTDLSTNLSKKSIGTDKGLAQIGDAVVNLAYSVGKSLYLSKNNPNKKIIRTGTKVNKTILSSALKKADLKSFAKLRSDAHDMANTVEAIVAYLWINQQYTLPDLINFISDHLYGNPSSRKEENNIASEVFTKFLNKYKDFLP